MLRTLVIDDQYIQLGIGIFGSALFLIGSILFFDRFQALHIVAIWLFTTGSACMLIKAIGMAGAGAGGKGKQADGG